MTTLPTRVVVLDDGQVLEVPRGIARNNRNQSWQVKVEREGHKINAGNFADRSYGSPTLSLLAARQCLVDSLTGSVPATALPVLQLSPTVTLRWIVRDDPAGKRLKHALVATVYDPVKKRSREVHLCTARQLRERYQTALVTALETLRGLGIEVVNLEALETMVAAGMDA